MDNFKILEADFYHYMINEGGLMPKTSRDYIYRLRFLSSNYKLNSEITSQYIEEIIDNENIARLEREIYNSKKAIADFRSCLRKFLSFIQSDYIARNEIEIENEITNIKNSESLSKTERESLIKSRVGQGLFRQNLIDFWGGCAISNCKQSNILVASHIKPWRYASNAERLDIYNGLLLLPNYDKLFDYGYISFKNDGSIIISSLIPEEDYSILGINKNQKLSQINDKHLKYLEYHRDRCFIK